MHPDLERRAETAAALTVALAGDVRFPAFQRRVEGDNGRFALLRWLLRTAEATEDGLATVQRNAGVDDVDYVATIERIANYILDRAVTPGGGIPAPEAITHFAVWAAHQS